MTKGCLRTLSLATAIAMTMAPVMARASLDPSTTSIAPAMAAGSSQAAVLQQGLTAQQIDARASTPSATPAQRRGSLRGFGPMETKPLPGVQPMQNGGDK
jgi:hypothetical protein